jgi:ribonucleoside-diphosphate reductase alpha chain
MSNAKHHSRSFVVNRKGEEVPVNFDEITNRLDALCDIEPKLDEERCDTVIVTQKIAAGITKGMRTRDIDILAAETCAHLCSRETDYGKLAARICISSLQKDAPKTFYECMKLQYENIRPATGEPAPLIAKDIWEIVQANREILDSAISPELDFTYDYFGYCTLERSYLVRVADRIVETPQYMLMRVSLGIHKSDISAVIETYKLLSKKFFTHATPTMFNSGTPLPQMSSW